MMIMITLIAIIPTRMMTMMTTLMIIVMRVRIMMTTMTTIMIIIMMRTVELSGRLGAGRYEGQL